jgi:hypothetical protein
MTPIETLPPLARMAAARLHAASEDFERAQRSGDGTRIRNADLRLDDARVRARQAGVPPWGMV